MDVLLLTSHAQPQRLQSCLTAHTMSKGSGMKLCHADQNGWKPSLESDVMKTVYVTMEEVEVALAIEPVGEVTKLRTRVDFRQWRVEDNHRSLGRAVSWPMKGARSVRLIDSRNIFSIYEDISHIKVEKGRLWGSSWRHVLRTIYPMLALPEIVIRSWLHKQTP